MASPAINLRGKMALRVAFQMDPIEAVDIDSDSTFRLALEAQTRGHEVFVYTPDQLVLDEGSLKARGRRVELRVVRGDHVRFGAFEVRDLADFDVVWLRQDPPFDMNYLTTTYLLDLISERCLVVNDPFWVRNSPEKLLVLQFPDLLPPTMITRSLEEIRRFRARHGDVILKPLYGNGGAGVFRITVSDRNLTSLYELFTSFSKEPLIVQKYLPAVEHGDKRVILVEGEPIGAINRIPPEGEVRSNLHVGGRAAPVALTERDREICDRIGPVLRERGQVFVGIDIIWE